MKMPSRNAPREVWLRLRHPRSVPIQSVIVNGKNWKDFDAAKEIVRLHDLTGTLVPGAGGLLATAGAALLLAEGMELSSDGPTVSVS